MLLSICLSVCLSETVSSRLPLGLPTRECKIIQSEKTTEMFLVVKNVKAAYSASWETHLRATERHLPYGITQCYLPPDTSERAPP